MCISSLTAFPSSFLVLISVVINTFTSLQFAASLPSSCLSLLNKVRINIYKMLKYFWSACMHIKRFWNSVQQSAVWTLISEMFALFACRNVTKLITCMAIQMLQEICMIRTQIRCFKMQKPTELYFLTRTSLKLHWHYFSSHLTAW